MKKFLEKIVTGIITCSGFLTSVIILLIVLFLFSEGFGLFSQKTIEEGYTLVVNQSNPVDELDAKEIKEIFDEDVTNWKEVGGSNEKITVFRFDEMGEYFTEEQLGANYENAGKCIETLVKGNSGIIAFVPETFVNDNIFTQMVQYLYSIDTPTNVFPSIHVYNSVAVAIAFMTCRSMQKHPVIRYGAVVLAVFIVLATMFLKQHSVSDVCCALILNLGSYMLLYHPHRIRNFALDAKKKKRKITT